MATVVETERVKILTDRITVILPPVLSGEKRIAEALDYSSLTECDDYVNGWGDGWGVGVGLFDGEGWGDGCGYGSGDGDGGSSTDV
jgi:hypothetical protein